MTLIKLQPGETRQIIFSAAADRVSPYTEYTIANLDETGTIYVGPSDTGRQIPDLASSGAASQLVALQSIAVTDKQDWYAFNPSTGIFSNTFSNKFGGGSILIDIIPNCHYWAPSPYQSALSLVDQGLMKDSTGQSILTGTNSVGTNTSNALTTGVPPNVPNILSISKVNAAAASSPFTLTTFASNSRLWQVSLSLACATSSAYTDGLQRVSAQVNLGSGPVLAVAETAISATNQAVTDHCDFSFNGIPALSGDTLILNVNNGGTHTGATIVCSTVVLGSTP